METSDNQFGADEVARGTDRYVNGTLDDSCNTSSTIICWGSPVKLLGPCWVNSVVSSKKRKKICCQSHHLNRNSSGKTDTSCFSGACVLSRLPRKRFQADDDRTESDILSTARASSTMPITSESATSLVCRPRGSVRKELVTAMFEPMLSSIVESWELIIPHKPEETTNIESEKTASEFTFTSKRKKSIAKPSKTKKSRSKLEIEEAQIDPLQRSWWSGADERAIIRFRNGNIYEGNISLKCMHGEGRFQWADGTIFMGQFKDNKINGKGTIQWKNDTWYEGEFVGNIRHGKGLYVDSREQRAYTGGWYCGTKHGNGVIYYSETFKNSYGGQWIHNVRHGYGCREYCAFSGYKGKWDKYIREGKGLMIWPNHDFYRGEWKNGLMSGYGIYIWDAYYNNSMSLPSINAYRGLWDRGERNGYGVLNLGLGLGSHYKGGFRNNKKHGVGKFVTNNGFILRGKNLFIDDNIGPVATDENDNSSVYLEVNRCQLQEPYKFDICDNTVGLVYHIEKAIANIDRQNEIRANLLSKYFESNKHLVPNNSDTVKKEDILEKSNVLEDNMEDVIAFEESSLRKSLRSYESHLKEIYHKYATVCNTEEIYFTPILIRLYLWQFYYDCNVHDKGLTLVEIDDIFHDNPEWLARTPHNPFEKIYFWQFLHSLISVASRLYAKQQLPSKKPDTILASAFRCFMERDVLPGVGRCKGRLVNRYGIFIPLKETYRLYRKLGEPHTVRSFLRAVRYPAHKQEPHPILNDASTDCLSLGHNVYLFGDEMSFLTDEYIHIQENKDEINTSNGLKLFNFGNLPIRSIIKIFSSIFPQLTKDNKIINLDVKITFFEFFEAFILCAEKSIRVKEEELGKSETSEIVPSPSPIGIKPK